MFSIVYPSAVFAFAILLASVVFLLQSLNLYPPHTFVAKQQFPLVTVFLPDALHKLIRAGISEGQF